MAFLKTPRVLVSKLEFRKPIAVKFYKCLGNTAVKAIIKLHSDDIISTLNLTILRLCQLALYLQSTNKNMSINPVYLCEVEICFVLSVPLIQCMEAMISMLSRKQTIFI